MSEATVELDLRPISPFERHDKIFKLWNELKVGRILQIINDHDPKPLHYQFEAEYKGEYEWEYAQKGPKDWIVNIKRISYRFEKPDGEIIPGKLKEILQNDGPVSIVTQGADGPHLVGIWNSSIQLQGRDTLVIPAGGYYKTQENISKGSPVWMMLSSLQVTGARGKPGAGFRITGKGRFVEEGEVIEKVRTRFAWARAAFLVTVERIEQIH